MAVDVLGLVAAAIALAPAAVIMYFTLGRYDGQFRDNVIFIYLLSGLFLGMLLALFQVYLLFYYSLAPGLPAALMYILGTPLLHHAAFTAFVNRKKWQGERHAIWNGIALGTGASILIALGFSIRTVNEFRPTPLLNLALLTTALTAYHFAGGARVGTGVLERMPFRGMLVAATGMIPLAFFLFEWYQGLVAEAPGGTFWLVLAAAYGILALLWAVRDLIPRALGPEGRKALRRKARRAGESD